MEKNIFMELLAAREFKAIRSILNVMNAVDIASLLSEFEEKELAQAFRLIPKAKAAEVFANMSNATQSCLIDAFTETELKEIIDDMFMDDTVDLLEDLPANVVQGFYPISIRRSVRRLIFCWIIRRTAQAAL